MTKRKAETEPDSEQIEKALRLTVKGKMSIKKCQQIIDSCIENLDGPQDIHHFVKDALGQAALKGNQELVKMLVEEYYEKFELDNPLEFYANKSLVYYHAFDQAVKSNHKEVYGFICSKIVHDPKTEGNLLYIITNPAAFLKIFSMSPEVADIFLIPNKPQWFSHFLAERDYGNIFDNINTIRAAETIFKMNHECSAIFSEKGKELIQLLTDKYFNSQIHCSYGLCKSLGDFKLPQEIMNQILWHNVCNLVNTQEEDSRIDLVGETNHDSV
jgi:hypothetical protein